MGGGEAGAGITALGRILVVTPSTRPPSPTACGRGPVRECPPTGCIHNWPKAVDSHRSPHKAETRAAVLQGTPRCRHRQQLDAAQKLRDRARGDVQTDRVESLLHKVSERAERRTAYPRRPARGSKRGGPGAAGRAAPGRRGAVLCIRPLSSAPAHPDGCSAPRLQSNPPGPAPRPPPRQSRGPPAPSATRPRPRPPHTPTRVGFLHQLRGGPTGPLDHATPAHLPPPSPPSGQNFGGLSGHPRKLLKRCRKGGKHALRERRGAAASGGGG